MRRFVPALRRISSELNLPEPVKARIILEMAADLEALYEHYRARGVGEDEAVRLTEERILSSPETLHHLVLVHTTVHQRWMSRAAEGLRWSFELLLFVGGVVPIVALSGWMVAARIGSLLADPFLWLLLAIGSVVTGIAVWKASQLFLGRTRSTAELHRGLFTLLFMGVLGPVVGGAAFLIHLYGLSMAVMSSRAGAADVSRFAEPLAQNATLLGMGLLLGIGAGLVWFVLVNRIAAAEQAESTALLAE